MSRQIENKFKGCSGIYFELANLEQTDKADNSVGPDN